MTPGAFVARWFAAGEWAAPVMVMAWDSCLRPVSPLAGKGG